MFHYISPPAPGLVVWQGAALAAGLIVLGAAMVIWGRVFGRVLVMFALAGAGLYLGAILPLPWLPPAFWQIMTAFVMLLAGFIIERLVWGALAGALLAIAPTILIINSLLPQLDAKIRPAATTPATDSLLAYLGSWWSFYSHAAGLVWDRLPLLLTGGLLFLAPLVLGLLRPRLIRIVMTAILGGACVVGGVLLAGTAIAGGLWDVSFGWPVVVVPLVLAIGLGVFGIIVQYRVEIREDRLEKAREAEPPGSLKKQEQAEIKRLKGKAKS